MRKKNQSKYWKTLFVLSQWIRLFVEKETNKWGSRNIRDCFLCCLRFFSNSCYNFFFEYLFYILFLLIYCLLMYLVCIWRSTNLNFVSILYIFFYKTVVEFVCQKCVLRLVWFNFHVYYAHTMILTSIAQFSLPSFFSVLAQTKKTRIFLGKFSIWFRVFNVKRSIQRDWCDYYLLNLLTSSST